MFAPQPHAAPRVLRPAPTRAPISVRLPADTAEVELLVTEVDGGQRTVSAYLAVVDGRAYLRPRGGNRCAWLRALDSGAAVALLTDGVAVPSRTEPVCDGEVQRRISEALLCRFGYDPAMPGLLDETSVARTVELVADTARASRAVAA